MGDESSQADHPPAWLIGITITSEPTTWLVSLGFVLAGICAAIGLGVLWSANLKQFPTPDEILNTSQGAGDDPGELMRRHFLSIGLGLALSGVIAAAITATT